MGQKYPIKPIELSYLVRVSFQLRNGCHLIDKSMFSEDRNCVKQNITNCGMCVCRGGLVFSYAAVVS